MSSMLEIEKIRIDGGTQFRVGLNRDTVINYADLMKDGTTFPPAIVFLDDDGAYWLADGFHRLAAAQHAKLEVMAVDIRSGSQRDAVLFSLGANREHGLYRSNDDKRKSVIFCLRDPELREMSQREIAQLCGVTQAMVSKVKAEIFPKPKPDEGDNGYHFDNPADVIQAMDDESRNKFITFMASTDNYVRDGTVRKNLQRYGLVTAYSGNLVERTALAAAVLDQLLEVDPWVRLEVELRQWNFRNMKRIIQNSRWLDKESLAAASSLLEQLEAVIKAAKTVDFRETSTAD